MGKYEDDFYMPKPASKIGSCGKSILLESNMLRLDIQDGQSPVFVYAVYFDLEETLEDRKLAVEHVRERLGSTHIYDGMFLFTLGKLQKCVTKFRIPHPRKPEVFLSFKAMYRSKSKLEKCQGLLKYLVTSLPGFLGFKQHHRVFYNPGICKKVPNSDIEVYGAYRLRVAQAELCPAIVVDVIHCLQRGRTIADVFASFNGKQESNMFELKKYCLGKFAADIVHNIVVKVGDVCMGCSAPPFLKVWMKTHPEKKKLNLCKEECLTVSSSLYSLLVNRNGMIPSPSEKNSITKYTRVSPNIRVKCIQRFMEAVYGNNDCTSFLQRWKINVKPRLLTVRARVLSPPNVSFGDRVCIQNSRLFWNPKEDAPTKKVFDSVELHTWSLFCLENDAPLARKLMASLFFESRSQGVKVGRGSLEIVKPKRKQQVVSLFAEKMLKKINADTQFVIVILPNTSRGSEAKEIYSHLKKISMTSCGVLSQMINAKTIKSRAKSTTTWNAFVGGVISGIICKRGGSLWCVDIPLKEKVMFVGMDVWHGSNNETFSVGSLVFSLNTNLLKIYSAAVLHEWRQEIFNSIRDHFILALKAFVEENKQLPDRIMIYRDGVLRRDYDALLLHELKQYLEVIDTLYMGSRPFLTMVVVQKRVYERFFVKLETGKYVNSPPGTVIDQGMTRKMCYDFFLNSMYRKKGTTIPIHYVMIYDNSNMSPDVFHQVTYSLCYSYFNWPGTFYVPSVVQYAHKLASYVGKVGVIPPEFAGEKWWNYGTSNKVLDPDQKGQPPWKPPFAPNNSCNSWEYMEPCPKTVPGMEKRLRNNLNSNICSRGTPRFPFRNDFKQK